jgi:hypothetical protein
MLARADEVIEYMAQQLRTTAIGFAAMIYPLLAAGLGLSVGCSGGVDRMAVADADQVAPEGCTLRLRSLGDRDSTLQLPGTTRRKTTRQCSEQPTGFRNQDLEADVLPPPLAASPERI